MYKNLRWKVLAIVVVTAPGGVVVHAAGDEGQAGPGPQGRRAPRHEGQDRRGAEGRDRNGVRAVSGGAARRRRCRCQRSASPASTEFTVEGVPSDQRSAVPRSSRTRSSARRSTVETGVGGTYTFRMKPERPAHDARGRGDAGAPDDRAAGQRVRRVGADRRAVRVHRRPDHRAAPGRRRHRPRRRS